MPHTIPFPFHPSWQDCHTGFRTGYIRVQVPVQVQSRCSSGSILVQILVQVQVQVQAGDRLKFKGHLFCGLRVKVAGKPYCSGSSSRLIPFFFFANPSGELPSASPSPDSEPQSVHIMRWVSQTASGIPGNGKLKLRWT